MKRGGIFIYPLMATGLTTMTTTLDELGKYVIHTIKRDKFRSLPQPELVELEPPIN